MDRKQFCVLISIINVCFGASVHYLDDDNKALSDGSGETNILLANIFIVVRAVALAGCTININGDLSDIQPLIIKPGSSAFVYPKDRTGIVYLSDNEEIEIYCTSGFTYPDTISYSAIAKCVDGNLFEVNNVAHSFKNFTCKSQAFHIARKTGRRCFNNAALLEIGFDLGNRFAKVLEVCHDEVTEETYYAKFQLTPASEG
jgi:hypothetical protein